MEKSQFDRFLARECTSEEEAAIIEWLQTPEGQEYLDRRLEQDHDRLSAERVTLLTPGLHSDKLFDEILKKIEQAEKSGLSGSVKKVPRYRRVYDTTSLLLRVAVLLLVIGTGSWFSLNQSGLERQQNETIMEPERFETAAGQQLDIKLSDGSRIRLNEKSELVVPTEFSAENRHVLLRGEAFFQVESDRSSPFEIRNGDASVEVLGTEFSVHTEMGPLREFIVAVTEGEVALDHALLQAGEERAILGAGDVGVLDRYSETQATINVEHSGAANFLSWMNRRLQFEEMPLAQVCSQLYRIYSLECEFQEKRMRELKLTTDISEFSIDRTLTIIAMSLNLEYSQDGSLVRWRTQ